MYGIAVAKIGWDLEGKLHRARESPGAEVNCLHSERICNRHRMGSPGNAGVVYVVHDW